MKRFFRLLFVVLLSSFMFISLVRCDVKTNNNDDPNSEPNENEGDPNHGTGDPTGDPTVDPGGNTDPINPGVIDPEDAVDYAGSIKLDMSSTTIKQEVTVKTFVDGDTTHFNVPTSFMDTGVIKARYLAINTPESTGKIEEYGKTASNFTKEKLSSATSIIIESDDDQLNADSTGGRYLLWVWYRTSENEDYRNLNIEILQNGLAIASNSAQNRYGDTCVAAINQAKALKLNVYSGQRDPNFYYGSACEITLKELRTNMIYSGFI